MLTANNICLNLNESEFKITIEGLTFYFSSNFYLNKFKNNVKNYIELETTKLLLKYEININLDLYFMISYYKKIEKRGFRIYDENAKKELTKTAGFVNQIVCY